MEAYRLHDDELSGQPEPRRIGRPLAGVYERTISDYQFSWMSGTAVKRCGKPATEQFRLVGLTDHDRRCAQIQGRHLYIRIDSRLG